MSDFTAEQKQYLAGFVAGGELARGMRGLPTFAANLGLATTNDVPSPLGPSNDGPPACPSPDAIHRAAQDRLLAEGQKLCPEELAKRAKHPFDMWDELQSHADESRFPKGTDVLLFKYHGLFFVAPAQNAYMCRLRFAGGMLPARQLRGLADLAERFAGGYVDVTTRANLQLREIAAANGVELLNGLQDLGVVSRGSGADNIRNITGTPTAGIDLQELIDTQPLCRQLHHYILNHRELYGLPRKFNIAFDGGGAISSLAETNDIGFLAVRVGEGKTVPPGVYFRVQLGGITGHLDFARDTGLLLKPAECLPAAVAMVKVFIEHGDRTDRKKARLKYLLDRWGFEKFLQETQAKLPFSILRLPEADCEPRGPVNRTAHVGIHAQKQPGLYYAGVVLPVGRLYARQMRGLADLAERYGSGLLRLTVWQNLLIGDVREADLPAVQREIERLGLAWQASHLRASLVACTGNAGCKFAATNTKRHALELIDRLSTRFELDRPLNVHLTGCPHSCAQHYIGDIGLLGTKVAVGEDMVEGYHVYLGGGYGEDRSIGREIYRSVPQDELAGRIESMLRAYLEHRHGPEESFGEFTRRLPVERLQSLFARAATTIDSTVSQELEVMA